jgi:hypothetical protein
LDEGTIEEVDRVIRSRSGGGKSIRRVSRPRQKLEDLFLDIVEKARAERAETSGAMHGGQTASFLQGGQESGDQLIERLTNAPEHAAEAPAASVEGPASHPSGHDEDIITSLTAEKPAEPAAPKPPPKPIDTSEVDRSVIDSLLSDRDAPEQQR